MAVLKSFELKGNKQSFASFISNLSPCDTPFSSMISKEGIDQTSYSWQTDSLAPAINTGFEEGSDFDIPKRSATSELINYTSTLRKVVQVSDTSEAISLHGRGKELAYQMEKSGKEIKRDLELMNLHNVTGNPGLPNLPSRFFGFEGLCAPLDVSDPDTGAITHQKVQVLSPEREWFCDKDVFNITYNLYLAGSKADKIMFHPRHAIAFSSMINHNPHSELTYRMFDNLDTTLNTQVKQIKDPLGRIYTLIPNRFMPEDKVYFFTESDWTQTILRSPAVSKLGKIGANDRYLLEMEVGLRHRNHFASGIMSLVASEIKLSFDKLQTTLTTDIKETPEVQISALKKGLPMVGADVVWQSLNTSIFSVSNETVTVGSDGTATAKLVPIGVGTAKLRILVDGLPLEAVIKVGAPLISVSASPSTVITGQTAVLSAFIRKSDGTPVGEGVSVKWVATPSADVIVSDGTVSTEEDSISRTFVTGKYPSAVSIVASVGATKSREFAFTVTSATGVIAEITLDKSEVAVGERSTSTLRVYRESTGENLTGVNLRMIVRPTWTAGALPDLQTNGAGVIQYAFDANEVNDYEIKLQIIGSIPLVESRPITLKVT